MENTNVPVISAKDLNLWYGDFKALKSISLDVGEREITALIGPSGCGKTTTLRMIAGLEDITSGELWIGDKLMNDVEPKDRDIAMVFQNYALYPHMTVYENMAFSLKLKKVPKDEIDKRVHEAAKILEIEHLLDRKPKALSGGQRQRVSIARAILKNPPILILDEATSALDTESERLVQEALERLMKSRTTIAIAHRLSTIKNADEICVLYEGDIVERGTHDELIALNGYYKKLNDMQSL